MSIDRARELLDDHVTFGPGTVTELPRLVAELGATRVLLVCGRRSFEASGAAEVLPDLERVAAVHRFSDFAPNTDAADLARGLDELARFEPGLVLGIGGGSALDMAKLLVAYGHRTAGTEVVDAIHAGGTITDRDLQLVLVPTTSGSGAETTHFAVVYTGQTKHSIAGPALRPDRIVLDPALSRSGSAYQRATSGIDAVCQAIESRWAVGGTDTSHHLAMQALPLLLEHLETFVTAPTVDAADGMSLGSHLAGRAIDVSKTTAAHALSYALTKQHGVSHGHAVATTLGPFIEAHAAASPDQLQPTVDPAGHREAVADVLAVLGATDGTDARHRFVQLLERIGLEPRPSALGVDTAEARERIVRSVNTERLGNDPLRSGPAELMAIVTAAG